MTLLVDLNIDPADHIIYEGVLSSQPLGTLEAGDSHVLEMALTFLSQGRFEIHAGVRTLGAPRNARRTGEGLLTAVVREQ